MSSLTRFPIHSTNILFYAAGKTAEQIQMHQSYVKKFYTDILRKAKDIKGKLHGSVDYHRLNTEVDHSTTY